MSASQPLLQNLFPLPGGQRRCCSHCHQRLPVAHAHILNEVLVSGLWKLYNAGGGPCQLNELRLTTSEHGNSNQWQWFGLAVKVEKNEKRTSKWLLTQTGRQFLRGEISLPRKVWTLRKGNEIEVVDREGSITLKEVSKEIWERVDYARSARAAA